MKNKIILPFAFVASLFFSLSFAGEPALWEQKLNAQIDFQKKVAQILLTESPELEELININLNLQITMLEMKREKYLYLINNHPNRLSPKTDFNFEWGEKDEINLIKTSKPYAALKDKKQKLKVQNQGHSMWPALRQQFSTISKTEEYKGALAKLKEVTQR